MAPNVTVQRTPTRSATCPIMMPPKPLPNQTSATASAGTDRTPSTSAAIALSATVVIHGAPKASARITTEAAATTQDDLVSIDCVVDCNIRNPAGPRCIGQAPRRPSSTRAESCSTWVFTVPLMGGVGSADDCEGGER